MGTAPAPLCSQRSFALNSPPVRPQTREGQAKGGAGGRKTESPPTGGAVARKVCRQTGRLWRSVCVSRSTQITPTTIKPRSKGCLASNLRRAPPPRPKALCPLRNQFLERGPKILLPIGHRLLGRTIRRFLTVSSRKTTKRHKRSARYRHLSLRSEAVPLTRGWQGTALARACHPSCNRSTRPKHRVIPQSTDT